MIGFWFLVSFLNGIITFWDYSKPKPSLMKIIPKTKQCLLTIKSKLVSYILTKKMKRIQSSKKSCLI